MRDLVREFISEIHECVQYWRAHKTRNTEDKLLGLAHSILVILDGQSPRFKGSISSLERASKDVMLNDLFYEINNSDLRKEGK
jgi:hypothetical protein